MFKGIDTQYTYETCIQRGFCEEHSLELIQDHITEIDDEFLRKAMLFIRINVLDPVYFKKFLRCDKVKFILQKTCYFSECISGNISDQAYDSIFILDSVAVFTLCHLSKICCFGALFKFKTKLKSIDPEIKLLYNLLHTERLQESDISHLNPLLQKNFIGCDLNLIKICYASTLLFVRNVCIKQNIQSAIETIEKDLLGDEMWEHYKMMGDSAFISKKYDSAINFYNTALTWSSFQIDALADRALTFIKLNKYKQAQMDSYIAIMIDPTFSKGYCQLSSSFFHQSMYKEALEVANCGLSLTTVTAALKEQLETIKIDSEIKLNIRKIEVCNNKSKIFINENKAENHNFPDLIEASDSDEGDSEKLPELVDGSDSDEYDTMKKKQMNNSPLKNKKHSTSKKKRNIPQVIPDLKTEEELLENAEIEVSLKEASEAILADCGFKALQIFRGPLRNFIESTGPFTTLQECEIVCIKYAYGFAYYKSGEYDDLQKSILIFREIIEKYESIIFPAAYYALGLTYRKLNRFRDSLIYLEKVKNILSKGIHFKVYSWPGMSAVIRETKSEILNELVDDLIKECDNPPNPDAVCRFTECEFQPAIYYTDPDFKGYMSITCSDQCCLQYHVQCWKTLKTQKELNDKEFLEEPCATPDCDGIIIKIQHIDKKGDVNKEFVSDSKKVGKNRWAKWEKKADVKEKKKKKAHNNKTEDGNYENTNEDKTNSRKNSFSRRESESSVEYSVNNATQMQEKEYVTELKQCSAKQNESSSNTPNCNEGVKYEILSSNVPSQFTSKTSIIKELPTNDAKDTCEATKDTFSGSIKQNSFFSPPKSVFQEPNTSTKETPTKNLKNSQEAIDSVSDSIKSNIYSYMSEFLQLHGPLKIDDPILVNELSIFPEEILETIKECGGIGEFLKNDLSFAYVGDTYVCDISDVGTAYQMLTKSSLPSDIKNLGSLENSDNFKVNKDDSKSTAQTYTLNPDAREYTPSRASDLNSKNNYKHLNASPLFKTTMGNPFGNTVFKFSQSVNKSTTNRNSSEFPANKDTAKNTTSFDSNPYSNPKLSFSTPSLNTKTAVVSNDFVNKPFSFEIQNKLCETKPSSEIKSTVISLNDSNNRSMSGSICKEITRIFNSGNNEMKDVKEFGDTLFELINLYYSNKLSSHHQAINSQIKPYMIKKIVEMCNTASLTDKVEEFSIENADHDSDSLLAENQHLLEQNIKLENEICFVKKQEKELSEELSNVKKSLASALSEVKIAKDELEQKEEDFVNMRKNLYDTLKDAYETIDKQRKGADVFKAEKNCLQKQLDNLKTSAEEAERNLKAEIESQVQVRAVKIQKLEKENEELKLRAKNADLQVLNLKKTEFLKKIEEKTAEATKRRKEVTDGLTMISSNLNPLFQASIATLTAQLGTFINDLNTIKINFVMKIDKQIDDVKLGSSLADLEEIELLTLPEMPSIEKTLTSNSPVLDKTLLGGNQPSLTTFASARASAAASAGFPSVMIPSVPHMYPTSSFFSQPSPFSVPSSLPVATTALPAASAPISSESKKGEDLTKNDSLTLLDLNHLQKSLSSSTSSVNSSASASLPSPEYFLNDNAPLKNLQNFDHSVSVNNCKAESSKVPPGIQKSEFSKAPGTNMISKTLHSKPNSSIYTLNGGLEAIPKVSEEERKKTFTSNQSNYEKLLSKLKDQFPGYTQEQLILFLKEFRNQRQGKLSGLPMDNIISQIGVIINSKKAEKKVPTKGLVNKKLVPDPKPKDPSPEPTTVKKKSAWGAVDAASEKKWSGNPTEDDCVICHEDMSNVNSYKVQCGHIFHEKCIRQWLQLKSDCPVCRVLLLLPEDYPSLS